MRGAWGHESRPAIRGATEVARTTMSVPRTARLPKWKRFCAEVAAAVGAAWILACPVAPQELVGVTVDAGSGRPVPWAQVSVVGADGIVRTSTLSDPAGRFVLQPPGLDTVFIHGEALGYLDALVGPLTGGWTSEVVLSLTPAPVSVEGLDVVADRVSPVLEGQGFYERKRWGRGWQLDRYDIEKRGWSTSVADALRALPGVSVDNSDVVRLRGMSSFKGECPYRVYLDGVLVVTEPYREDALWARELVPIQAIEGMEVYARPSQVPIQWGGRRVDVGSF